MNNNGCIIPEIDEQNIGVQQENATFLVIGDEAYTSEIIEEYNRNAAAKTEEFNINATNKTNDFNTNYDNKLEAFNSNAATKTEDFDSHVTAQTTNFNDNAETATTNFNRNAAQQTDEFNRNAMSYSQGIEENKKNIASTSNELYHLKTDILETGESSGNNIHLEDSAWAELQEIKVDGVLSQETTNGYQLFDVSKVTTIHNGTIENEIVTSNALNGDGQGVTYNFPSITLTANTTYYIFADIRIKSGTGSVNGINNGVVGWEKVSFSSLSNNYNTFISKYTPTENENIYAVYLGFNNANNLIINIQNVMITTDRNATYEKYTGNQPSPSPDYPQEIKTITGNLKLTSCGKNLFDKSTSTANNYLNSSDGSLLSSSSSSTSDFIDINENTQYTISGYGTASYYKVVAYYNSSKIFISSIMITNTYDSHSFTTPSNAKYIRFHYTTSNENQVMLNEGTTALPYEPYQGSSLNITIPSNEFGAKLDDTYKDTLRTEYFPEEGQYHLMLDKKVGKYVFTGNENIVLFSSANDIKQYYYILNTCLSITNQQLDNIYVMSNYFKGVAWQNSWTKNNTVTIGLNKRLFIYSKEFTSIDELKNFLSTHNTEVYYALETPYTLDLGVIDMPLTYDEITNIFTDSDLLPTINVKYYRNFTATIQNLQVNNDTLKNELSNIESRLTALENANKNVADSNPTEESEVTE